MKTSYEFKKFCLVFLMGMLIFSSSGCSSSGGSSGGDSIPQYLPNMAQTISPLAPPGSRFETLNPDLPGKPDWLAGQAVTTVVSPDHKT